ncbi:MAG: cysteine--tRNA ligase [Magnetospiraceae bacterium]
MGLQLYNTLTRARETFEPLDAQNVRLYVCGPTVYDFAHIGNARPVIVFDVLYRLLQHLYPKVTYVRNITDVDDKIIAAAQANGEQIGDLTARTEAVFKEDMRALSALDPDVQPRATEHIAAMIQMIGTLVETGHAYAAEGHVLFAVGTMADYGALSNRSRDDQIAGARVDVAPYKKDPADFVLWKPSSPDQPGWDSPWGRGRPGWHIECSAMSERHLGETFDIHGGGQDLIFPHHENERAQSQCAHHGAPFVRYWVHNGYLMVEGEKMSKSLGNFLTVHDLLQDHAGETLRLCMLSTHYRQPLNWTNAGLEQAKEALNRFYTALRSVERDSRMADDPPEAVLQALEDDLNTPAAIAALHDFAGQVNRAATEGEKRHAAAGLLAGGRLLGVLNEDPEDWFKKDFSDSTLTDEAIDDMIRQRREARAARDFAAADKIRDDLAEQGILLEDGPEGTQWRRR